MNSKTTLIALLSIAAASGSVFAQYTPGSSDLYARDQYYDLEARYAEDYNTLARRQYDEHELLAREIVDHLSRRELHEKREFLELLARAVEGDDESGAGLFHWVGEKLGLVDKHKGQSSGNSQVVVVNTPQGQQGQPGSASAPPAQGAAMDPSMAAQGAYKRGFEDYEDLARREMMEDLIARAFYEHLETREDHFERREFMELLARAADGDDESGAGLFHWVGEKLGLVDKHKGQSSGNSQVVVVNTPQGQQSQPGSASAPPAQGMPADPNAAYAQDPSMAAPQKRDFDDFSHLERREFMDLLARAAEGDEESGAGLFHWVGEKLGLVDKHKDQSSGNSQVVVVNTPQGQRSQGSGSAPPPAQAMPADPNAAYAQDPSMAAVPQKRSFEDFSHLERREFMNLIARAAEGDEESGAGLFHWVGEKLGLVDKHKGQSSGNSQVVMVNAPQGGQGGASAPPPAQGMPTDPNAAYAQDPSMAAPQKRDFDDFTHLERREFIDLLARAADGDEESGAGLFHWIGEKLGLVDKDKNKNQQAPPPPPAAAPAGYADPNAAYADPSMAGGAYPPQKRAIEFEEFARRDFDEHEWLAREIVDHLSRRDVPEKREFMELLTRAAEGDEESGAGLFHWIGEKLGIVDKDKNKNQQAPPPPPAAAPAGYADPNAAYAQDPSMAAGGYPPQKRDYDELARREYEMHELIARDIVDNLDLHEHEKRELIELLARAAEDAGADGQDEQSGAGIFSIFTKVLGPILGFGGGSNNRRDFSLNELD